jgi:hypothetical protein
MTTCKCTGLDGCHLCNPQSWKQVSEEIWVPKRILGESEMHEHYAKEELKKFNIPVKEDESFENAKHNIIKQQTGIEVDENAPETVTQLLKKNQAPMIIRKYQGYGWPLFVAIICDLPLDDLDRVVTEFVKECQSASLDNIQMFMDWCGSLSQRIVDHYNEIKFGSVEGVAVVAYWDKCLCSSLYGDHMTHGQCRLEIFSLLNMMTQM